jgi:hypothetical protein
MEIYHETETMTVPLWHSLMSKGSKNLQKNVTIFFPILKCFICSLTLTWIKVTSYNLPAEIYSC